STGPWAYADWEALVAHVPDAKAPTIEELPTGYRVPAPVIRLANTLLPRIAPRITPVDAVREGPEPAIELVDVGELPELVAAETLGLREDDRTVGVIAPDSLDSALRAAFGDAGIQVGDVRRDALTRQVTLLDASEAKGLEFDRVVVVEPAA